MKVIPIFFTIFLSTGLMTGEETSPKPLTVEQLEKAGILGRLGLPLGEITGMEGEIISGRATGAKTSEGIHLVRITSVAGKALPEPADFQFTSTTGKIIPTATKLKFRGYETGAFTGLPKNWPDDVPRHAGVGFHFESRIVILAVP